MTLFATVALRLAGLALVFPAPALGAEPPPVRAVVLPEMQSGTAALAAGVGRYLHRALELRGVRVVPYGSSARRPLGDREAEHRQLGQRVGADRLVFASWKRIESIPILEVLVFDGRDGTVRKVHRGRAKLGELGVALHTAAQSLWGPVRGSDDPIPELWQIARTARAEGHLSAARLPEAWRVLEGLQTPVADALRREIDRANERSGMDPARRSRLATASGRADPDWGRVRAGLSRARGPWVLLAAAEAARARRDRELALRLFSEARKILGRDAANAHPRLLALAGVARSQAELGRTEAARLSYAEWLREDPTDPAPRAESADLKSVAPVQSAAHWLTAGDLYRDQFEIRRAARAYEKAALVDRERRGEVEARLAYLATAIGDDRGAVQHFREAERAGATPAALAEARGLAALRRGEVTRAERYFRAALEHETKRPGALAGLGLALAAEGGSDAAMSALELALAASPAEGAARLALARLHLEHDRDAEALRILMETPGETEERAALGYLLGRALSERDPAEASAALATVRRDFRSDPDFQSVYADALERSGDAAAAGERRRRAEALRARFAAVREQGLPLAVSLARLVESFPLEDPSRGEPLGRVGFLGLTRPLLGRERLHLWPRPDATALEVLETELRTALSERYEIETVEPPPSLTRSTERLRAFSDGLVDVAGLNRHLRTHALFTARLVGGDAEGTMRLEARLLGGSAPEQAFILTNDLSRRSRATSARSRTRFRASQSTSGTWRGRSRPTCGRWPSTTPPTIAMCVATVARSRAPPGAASRSSAR